MDVFNRVEKKYILNKEQFDKIKAILSEKMKKDSFHDDVYTISSIYLDTDNFDLIRKSIDKPIYREKVRLRCYGVPSLDSKVFLEIKKKYNGFGNKRRISLKLKDAYLFINGNLEVDSQIGRELKYVLNFYNLKPKVYIVYDRLAFQDGDFRITLDFNIRSRIDNLYLESHDNLVSLDDNIYIMEAKSLNAYPSWFINVLSDLKIYPKSFSKYGNIYKKLKQEGMI